MMKFYNVGASGNAYKVRILLALLRVPHEVVLLDLAKREHKTPEFLHLNPRGEVPVIEDAGAVVWDSGACLVYLARKHGGDQWLPIAPAPMAEVMQWLSLAASEVQFGLQYARRGLMQKRWTAGTLEQNHAIARVALTAIEQRLEKMNGWHSIARPSRTWRAFPTSSRRPNRESR